MIGLSSSAFYYAPLVPREEREKQDAELRDRIERVQTEHSQSGYRTMLHYLRRSGVQGVGERKLRRIMKKYDLHARLKRAFVATTDSNHSHRIYPNLLPGRTVMGLDEVWTVDLTYIRIANGFVYLAIVLDLYSRRVIGWSVSKRIDGDLAVAALRMAIGQRKPRPGCIHHSDRGVQGGFNRSSQHLKKEKLRWENPSVDAQIGRGALFCIHRGGRGWGNGSITKNFGRPLLAD